MRINRTALVLGALLPVTLAFQPRETSLTFKPTEGLSLTKTFTQNLTMTLDDLVVAINDEEMEVDEIPELTIESHELIVLVDDYGAVEDGRPLRVSRMFETLERRRLETNSEGEEEAEETSELESLEVVFAWDADDEEYVASFGDDVEDGDEDLLEGLWCDVDFSGFLPDGEVEEGDTWEVDYEDWLRLIEPSGKLTFLDEDGDPTEDDLDRMLRENTEAEITCEFKGVRDEDGEEVAVIEITFETESEATEEEDVRDVIFEADVPISSAIQSRTVELEVEGEGEFLWLIREGRFLSFEGMSTAEISMESSLTIEPDDGEVFTQSQTLYFLGENEVSVTFE